MFVYACVCIRVCLYTRVRYLSQVEEEAGVLSCFGEVREEHRDADQQHRGVFPNATQRLSNKTINKTIKQKKGAASLRRRRRSGVEAAFSGVSSRGRSVKPSAQRDVHSVSYGPFRV